MKEKNKKEDFKRYEDMSKKELMKEAEKLGIAGREKLDKAELVKTINGYKNLKGVGGDVD